MEQRENPEINFDVERVLKKLDYFKFDPYLSKLLDKIQIDYNNAKTEEEFNDVLGKIRKFYEHLLKHVSDKISSINNKPIVKIGKKPSIQGRRDYLKKVDFIEKNEYKLIDSLYGISSNEGIHSLISKQEYVRICRNMIIEISLFLLTKLEILEKFTKK